MFRSRRHRFPREGIAVAPSRCSSRLPTRRWRSRRSSGRTRRESSRKGSTSGRREKRPGPDFWAPAFSSRRTCTREPTRSVGKTTADTYKCSHGFDAVPGRSELAPGSPSCRVKGACLNQGGRHGERVVRRFSLLPRYRATVVAKHIRAGWRGCRCSYAQGTSGMCCRCSPGPDSADDVAAGHRRRFVVEGGRRDPGLRPARTVVVLDQVVVGELPPVPGCYCGCCSR